MPKDDDPDADPAAPFPDDEEPHLEDDTRSARVYRFAKRLLDRKELAGDTRDLLHAVLNTSDKAKSEAVRMLAREVRVYLKELKLKEDLLQLARSHSLEISIHLKPLIPDPVSDPAVPVASPPADGTEDDT